jgi:hypothetical protein
MVTERELIQAKENMDLAYKQMNDAASDYIDAAIVKYNAARATYDALLREAKKEGILTIAKEERKSKLAEKEGSFLERMLRVFF